VRLEEWVQRALQRWPDVPALFGWLGLDRRGRWRIRGEVISRPQIIDTINRNYAADPHGRWYFQNGPQRGYVTLERAPLILHVEHDVLVTHTQQRVANPSQLLLDEEGCVFLTTEHGPGALVDTDLDWVLARLRVEGKPVDDGQLAQALALSSGQPTALRLSLGATTATVTRCDRAHVAARLSFVRDPQPRADETVATRVTD